MVTTCRMSEGRGTPTHAALCWRGSTHTLLAVLQAFSPVNLSGFPQEPRHLQFLADLEDCSVFSLIAGRKQYNAPTDFGFCIKVRPLSLPARCQPTLTIPLDTLEFKQ